MNETDVIAKIKDVLAEAEPYVAGHSGSITFVSWEPTVGRVSVLLQGACEGCAMSGLTVKFGLGEALRAKFPEFREVVVV